MAVLLCTAGIPRDLWGQIIVDHLQQSNSLVARTSSLTTSSPGYTNGCKPSCHMAVHPRAVGMWMVVPICSPGMIFSVLKLTHWELVCSLSRNAFLPGCPGSCGDRAGKLLLPWSHLTSLKSASCPLSHVWSAFL